MRNLLVALFVLVALAGCLSIPKPDWNPGTTAPAPQTATERPTCPLPAQWDWNYTYKQWVCVVPPPIVYYGPTYYYGPPVIIHRGWWPHGHRGYRR